MTQDNEPEQQSSPRPLDYQTPVATAKAPIGTAIVGVVFGVISVFGAQLLGSILNAGTGMPFFVGVAAGLVALFVLLLLARSAFGKSLPIEQRQRRRRFYIVGFIIGCGIGALLEGLCFAALSKIQRDGWCSFGSKKWRTMTREMWQRSREAITVDRASASGQQELWR